MNLLGRSLARSFLPMRAMSYSNLKLDNVIWEKKDYGVGLIMLNRPKALNALCDELFDDINSIMSKMDQDPEIGAIVLTGSKRAFAAGADIKEMLGKEFPQVYTIDMLSHWENVAACRTPIIAAVNGFALGGGCELAMMCDIIYAGDKAKFGQPEINLGTIPGMGGSQRMTKAIGKSRTMEMVLTGEFMGAEEAVSRGLASKLFEAEILVDEALKTAKTIASKSKPVVVMAKECVNEALESGLQRGLKFERRIFHSTFGTHDRREGMKAFSEKRAPEFKDE
jgi:enoyl-CoA hydratase/carnithine racemase